MTDPADTILDLDPETARALEFDELCELVASYARTPMGGRRIRTLAPLYDLRRVRSEQAAVTESVRHLVDRGRLLPGALPEPTPALRALAVEGARIAPADLRDLAAVARAAAELRALLERLDDADYPELHGRALRIPDLRREAAPVLRHVDPDGRVGDGASPELAGIRAASARLGERLRRMLEQRLRDPEADGVIRDDFVTQRNGRFVIPVRTDAPRQVRGIVHARSSSGATLFVEPIESVAGNNELVALAEEEQEEQERVLGDWAERFRARRDEVAAAVAAIAEADALQARGLFADAFAAVAPQVEDGGELELVGIRHPLLARKLQEQGGACVPLDLGLAAEAHVLVLSGPNTGGKTVALKTLGLAVLMAQSGIPVPAERARLPLFRQLRADIGDHQSIEADLSTFSAHLRSVVRFLDGLDPPALMLFDEIGTGTEPAEGAALARSVLEELLRPGVVTMATTHHGALKAWAVTTTGVESAAMEFDTPTLRPTFRVLMGAAGVSAGLEIARRLGLEPGIVERARRHLGDRGERGEAYLERLRELTRGLERRSAELELQLREAERERRAERERAVAEAERRAAEAGRQLERVVADFRKRARAEVEAIADARERARADKRRRRVEDRLAVTAARERERLEPGRGSAATGRPLEGRLAPGMSVHVRSLGKDGTVSRVRGRRVEVTLGRVTFTVDREDLGGAAAEGGPPDAVARGTTVARGRGEPEPVALELTLIGKRVREALPELDKFLDGAALAGHEEVRVIHGHGTGRLRQAVREFLREHPLVAEQRPGRGGEGGDGATVVRIR